MRINFIPWEWLCDTRTHVTIGSRFIPEISEARLRYWGRSIRWTGGVILVSAKVGFEDCGIGSVNITVIIRITYADLILVIIIALCYDSRG